MSKCLKVGKVEMSDYVGDLLLGDTVRGIQNGSLPAVDLIHTICDRIEALDDRIHALLPEKNRRGRLLADLAVLENKYPDPLLRPPLFGVPVGVKDIFRVEGFETRAGSRLPASLFEGDESWAVTALKKAGALILGKTVSTEFAWFQPGPTCNPHNPLHTPGGSSSGSAAAVAAGFAPLALGTQTIGSILRPASYCGVYGFKPSLGRIPTAGVIPFSPAADHVGFFTGDFKGAEMVFGLLVMEWKQQEVNALEKPVLGIPTGDYLHQANPGMLQWFDKKCAHLKQEGFRLIKTDVFGDIRRINSAHRQIIARDFAETHEKWFRDHGALYGEYSIQLISEGQKVSDQHIEQALQMRAALNEKISQTAVRECIDVWLSPSSLDAAPPGLQSTGSPLMNLPWTFLGYPAFSIPAGKDGSGLPLGIQAAAAKGKDEKLTGWCRNLVETAPFE